MGLRNAGEEMVKIKKIKKIRLPSQEHREQRRDDPREHDRGEAVLA